MTGFHRWGFDDAADYGDSLKSVYREFGTRAFNAVHAMEEVEEKPLKKVLGWLDVSCLGVGLILGAGIFVSTGTAAGEIAGPAVVLSFVLAGISAILSTLCYSEFAVRFPLAGGAFNYLLFSMGELTAFLCVCTLILEYVLANAAVARSFAPYLGQLIGKGSGFFVFPVASELTIDPLAAGLVAVCVVLVVISTEHSNKTNLIITIVHVAVVLVIMIAGFVKAKHANLVPFVPPEADGNFGIRGIFNGASFVFFSFIGFDCVSTMAEEVRNPRIDMPVGIVSCITFVTIIYVLMALSLVGMVKYTEIDTHAAFAAAFETAGWPWMRVIVALGALLGIVTGVLVGSMAVARIFSAVGRAHLVFPVVGRIHDKFNTPAIAAAVLGLPTMLLALFSDLPHLVNLVSAGTLFVFGVVALALIIKRYTHDPAAGTINNTQRLIRNMLVSALLGSATCLGIVYNVDKRYWVYLIAIAIHIVLTVALHLVVPQGPKPEYTSPLFPYVPSASLLINAWLCSTLPADAWWQYAIFLGIILVVYLVYSAASSLALEEHSALRKGRTASFDRTHGSVVRVLSERRQSSKLEEFGPDGAKVLEGTKAVQLV